MKQCVHAPLGRQRAHGMSNGLPTSDYHEKSGTYFFAMIHLYFFNVSKATNEQARVMRVLTFVQEEPATRDGCATAKVTIIAIRPTLMCTRFSILMTSS